MNIVLVAIAFAFWACFALVLYAYLGYPLLIYGLATFFGRRVDPPAVAGDEDLPSVSLLVAAHNEGAVIEERIENALAADYPSEKLEIVVASDGSSDETPALVRRYADRGVRLLDYAQRRGKAAVLNESLAEVEGEIVLLSDANTMVDRGAVRRLVRWFNDPQVGAVCGRLVLCTPKAGRNADSIYWRYETLLKRCEGRLGALLGANGAIYAIRGGLYVPIPDGTLVDDFVIPLLARLRTGCKIVYEADALAWEETPLDVAAEFHRRARIGAGGFQSIGMLWKLLDPRQGWIAFTFLSHKVLRWLCPFFLIALLAGNIVLALFGSGIYRLTLAGQVLFYGTSLLAAFLPAQRGLLNVLRLTTMFSGMNLALLVGFFRWVRGSQQAAWRRTTRVAEVSGAAP